MRCTRMTSTINDIAHRLQGMLEKALTQLKVEQSRRKEADIMVVEVQKRLGSKEQELSCAKERFQKLLAQKDEKISALLQTIQQLGGDQNEDLGTPKENNDTSECFSSIGCENEIECMEEDTTDESNNEALARSMVDTGFVKEEFEEVMQDPDSKDDGRSKVEEDNNNQQKATGHINLLPCKLCEKTFKTKYTLKSHEETVHSNELMFKCSKCEQRFKDASSCRRHQVNNQLHKRLEKEKQSPVLLCCICGKQFARQRRWSLDQHYLSHIQTQRLPCKMCDKKFTRKSYLVQHMAKNHSTE